MTKQIQSPVKLLEEGSDQAADEAASFYQETQLTLPGLEAQIGGYALVAAELSPEELYRVELARHRFACFSGDKPPECVI